MKNTTAIIILVAAFIAGLLIFYHPQQNKNNQIGSQPSKQEATQKWETKTEEQASVTVVVTPLDLSPNSKEWKFDVGMNTHSVELDQNMTKITVLVDDKNKEYNPIGWDGPTGGHHREGVISFNAVQPIPQSVELKIKDIAGIPERSFKWDLK